MRYLSTRKHNFLISFINYRAILILLMINWDKFSNYLIPSLLNRMLKRFNTKFLTQFFIQTKLYKIGFRTNDLCSFCKSQSESLNHLFFHCPYSKQFWNDLEIYWCSISSKRVRLSLQNVLVGIIAENTDPLHLLLNYFIMIGKLFCGIAEITKFFPIFIDFEQKMF